METKELLYGLIGFFIGGLLVSVAATTFNNAELQKEPLNAREICIDNKQEVSEER